MAMFKKTVLGSAILVAIAASSTSYGATPASSGNDIFSNSFFSDSKLNLNLKNYYRKDSEKLNTASSTTHLKAWAQAMHIDFKSGWLMNWVGLDLSSYYSLKLSGKKGESDVGLLAANNEGKTYSVGKVGYAFKVNLMDHGEIRYGRMLYDTLLLKSQTEFAIPQMFEGFYGNVNWNGLTGYAGYVSKASYGTDSSFDNLSVNKNSSGDEEIKKRGLVLYGLEYKINHLSLRAEQMSQEDYIRHLYADATYMWPTKDMGDLTFGAQYGHNSELGAHKDRTKDASSNYKTSLGWWGAMVNWKFNNFSAGLSHVSIGNDASKHNSESTSRLSARATIGVNDEMTAIGNQFVGYTSGIVNDFDLAGTASTKVNLGYDFSDFVKGLSASAGYIFGTIDQGSGNKDHDASEFDVSVNYQIPFVNGLSAEVQHGRYLESWKDSSDIKYKDRERDTRIMLNYEIAIF